VICGDIGVGGALGVCGGAMQIPYRRGAKTQDEIEQDILREQNENALAQLSAYKLNVVAHGLCSHIERMLKVHTCTPH
jgi:hypothetical protein